MKTRNKKLPVIFNYLEAEKEIAEKFRQSIVVLAKAIHEGLTALGITLNEKKLTRRSIKSSTGIELWDSSLSVISFSTNINETIVRKCQVWIMTNSNVFLMFEKGKLLPSKKYEDINWTNYLDRDLENVRELKRYNQLAGARRHHVVSAAELLSVLDEIATVLKK